MANSALVQLKQAHLMSESDWLDAARLYFGHLDVSADSLGRLAHAAYDFLSAFLDEDDRPQPVRVGSDFDPDVLNLVTREGLVIHDARRFVKLTTHGEWLIQSDLPAVVLLWAALKASYASSDGLQATRGNVNFVTLCRQQPAPIPIGGAGGVGVR